MKRTRLVVELASRAATHAFLARAQRTKVLARTRAQVVEELEYDASDRLVVEFDVEKATRTLLMLMT